MRPQNADPQPSRGERPLVVVFSCGVFPEKLFENPVSHNQYKWGEAQNIKAVAIFGYRSGRSCVFPLCEAKRRAYRNELAGRVLRATTKCMFCSNMHANARHRSETHHLVAAKSSAQWMPCEGGSNVVRSRQIASHNSSIWISVGLLN